MGKHTPGPWQINKRSEWTVETQQQRGIASTAIYSNNTDGGYHDLENKANAKLIAAAPEMLEALKHLINACSRMDAFMMGRRYRALLLKAREAINKATI